jgi:predicted MPP superfamily phosphohydrolase
MFGLILTLIASLMHGYLAWRISSLEWFDSGLRRHHFLLLALSLWLIYLSGTLFSHDATGGIAVLLDRLSLDWLGGLFITTTVMLALDLLTGFGLWAKPILNRLRRAGLVLALLLIGVALWQGMRTPDIVRYEVALPGLPPALDGARLVVLSDLHLGSQLGAHWLAARIAQVETLKPDLIVLLGDLFEGHGRPDNELQPLFARLQAPLGVYAVTGNHEFHADSQAAILMSETAGVEWLRDRWKVITPGLILAGVDDLTRHNRKGDNGDRISPLLQGRPKGATILLSHSPLQVEQAAAAGTGLMLSGHTHGGQIWPFSYLVARNYPYLAGKYRLGEMSLIVSRGTGLWGPRMRLWESAEIIEVALRVKPSR